MKIYSYEKVTYEIDDDEYWAAIRDSFTTQDKAFSLLNNLEKCHLYETVADSKTIEVFDIVTIANNYE